MIAQRTIISGSTGPIFAIFSPNESVLGADDRFRPFFVYLKGHCHGNQFLWKNGKLPSFVALAFQNVMGYHCLSMRINGVNDASISCKNFVNIGRVTPELTELICELRVRYGKKLAYLVEYLRINWTDFCNLLHTLGADD